MTASPWRMTTKRPEAGPGPGHRQLEGDEAQPRHHDGRGQRDQPARQHRHPGRARQQREQREQAQQRTQPPRRADVAEPADQQADHVHPVAGEPAGLEQQALGGPGRDERHEPRRQQHRHRRQGHDGRAPAVPVPEQARGDEGGDAEDDGRGQHREEPHPGDEGRAEGHEQRGAPRRAPAAVAVRVGEAEGRVGRPGQQGGDGDGPEAALAPRPRGDRHEAVGHRAPHVQPAGHVAGVDEVADDGQQPPRTPGREGDGQEHQRRDDHDRGRRRGCRRRRRGGRTPGRGRRCPTRGGARSARAAATTRRPRRAPGTARRR